VSSVAKWGYMVYHKELSDKVIGAAIEVHKVLGSGLLEKVYENALLFELQERGIKVEQQKKLDVYYKNRIVGKYIADIIVENKIVIELKACNMLNDFDKAQLINYLKITRIKVGYLINFGAKAGLEFKRIVN